MRPEDSGGVPDHENGENEKQMQETDAPITEDALTAVLADDGAHAEKPLQDEDGGGVLQDARDGQQTDTDRSVPDAGDSGEPSAPERREASDDEGVSVSESDAPTPPSQDMDAVFETVHQLQTLDTLLKKLNFRELIIQFGQLQADLETLHDGIQHVRKMVEDGEALLLAMIGNEESAERSAGIPLSVLNARLELLHRVIQVVVNRIRLEQKVQGEGRDHWIQQVDKAMAAMSKLHEVHQARMEMIQALSEQVDSPSISNQQLASSALEFAVYMREMDATPAATAFEEAFAELELLRETIDDIRGRNDMGELDFPEPEALDDAVRFLGNLPELIGELSALLNNLSSELAGLAEGVRAARPTDEPSQP